MAAPYVKWSERRASEKRAKAEKARRVAANRKARKALAKETRVWPHAGLTPMSEIAQRLGVSKGTVSRDYNSAIRKLRATPGSFELILGWIHACAETREGYIRCGSVECNREYIALYAQE